MTFKISLFALSLTLGVALSASAAQDHPFVVYQNALIARPVPTAVKEYCDGKAGKENTPKYKACRVTRLFLSDIAAKKDAGYPPLTDPSFVEETETDMLLRSIEKYGG